MSKKNKLAAESLFWLHTSVIAVLIISGLLVPFWAVVLALLIVRGHQVLVGGCLITKFQIKAGGVAQGHTYFEVAAKRFLGIRLGKLGVATVATIVTALALGISLAASHYHYRMHL